MNWKTLLSLFIIFTILGLLMFSPKGRKFQESYTGKFIESVGSFFKNITGRAVKTGVPLVSRKLDVTVTGVDPISMRGQEFDIKGTGFEGELSYDLISLMGGSVGFPTNRVEIKIDSMIGMVSFYKNGKMKISGRTNLIELNGMGYNKTDIEFLIVGTPISYTLDNIEKNKLTFSRISGSLVWGGFKGIPPLLKNDELDLIGFEGMIKHGDESVTILGEVDKIRLNGVDISLMG